MPFLGHDRPMPSLWLALCLCVGLGVVRAVPAAAAGPEVVHLPTLHDEGTDEDCRAEVLVQSLGCEPTKALLLLWGEAGACPPGCAGPLRVACSALLAPGATWRFPEHELPLTARSGILFSISARDLFELPVPPEPVLVDRPTADYVCQVLFFSVVGNCHGYRRFKQSIDEGGRWSGIDLGSARGARLAVEVQHRCQQAPPLERERVSAYTGLAASRLGVHDPVFGGHAHHLPLLESGGVGGSSRVHLHNAGAECTAISLWLASSERCNRARLCGVDQLAPGETRSLDVADCVGGGWIGSGWIRSSQALAVVVATAGEGTRSTYVARPEGLAFSHDGAREIAASYVLHAPLAFSEAGGWSSGLQLQNRSGVRSARVRLDFVDAGGTVAASMTDWLCPRGSRSYFLPLVSDLPRAWRGAIRVESLPVGAAPLPPVDPAPIAGVLRSARYADVTRTTVLEAASAPLLAGPEPASERPCPSLDCAGLVALPELRKALEVYGRRSELAITNLVDAAGATDLAVYLFDENGMLDFLCLRLPHRQSAYLNLDAYAFLRPGFRGGAVVSAVAWRHVGAEEADVESGARPLGSHAPALAVSALQRTRVTLGEASPDDGALARLGTPILRSPGDCRDAGWPRCPELSP